jgi:hypothetical protein
MTMTCMLQVVSVGAAHASHAQATMTQLGALAETVAALGQDVAARISGAHAPLLILYCTGPCR